MGEDDDGDAVGLEDPVDLAEGLGEHLLKAAPGLLHPARLAGVGHHLLGLGGQRRGEELGVKVPHRPLEPDEKEVGEIRIGHVVVVGRIGQDGIKEVVRVWKFGRRPLLNPRNPHGPCNSSKICFSLSFSLGNST